MKNNKAGENPTPPRPRPRFFAARTFRLRVRNPQKRQQLCGRGGRRGLGRNAAPPSALRCAFAFFGRPCVFCEIVPIPEQSSNLFRRESVPVNHCAFAPLGARRRADGGRGCGGRSPSALPLRFRAPPCRFFRAGISEERNSENLAAQIHHLIRKRFCHLSR